MKIFITFDVKKITLSALVVLFIVLLHSGTVRSGEATMVVKTDMEGELCLPISGDIKAINAETLKPVAAITNGDTTCFTVDGKGKRTTIYITIKN